MPVEAPPFWTAEIGDFVQRVNAAWIAAGAPAVRLTSWWRSRYRNAVVGGHPNSQHLTGLAIDVSRDAAGSAFANAAAAYGLVPINEGDHWHIQRFPAGGGQGLCCGVAGAQVR